MQWLDKLISFAEDYKKYNSWFDECDPFFYFFAIEDELKEVRKEILDNDKENLEDELGDLLWVTLNLISKLDATGKIDRNKICTNAYNKFSERMPYVLEKRRETDPKVRTKLWREVKAKQKHEREDINPIA